MPRRYCGALAALGALAVLGAAGYGVLWPLRVATGWQLVDTIDLPRPDSLALDKDGRPRYVTTQTRPGRLLELTATEPRVVFGDFGEPDGLLLGPGTVIVTEEEDDGRVMEYDLANATVRVLGRMNSPEGVLRRADGSLLVAQDQPQGHLWLLREGAAPVSLVDGLDRPEGLCNLPDGRIGIAESGRGRILAHGPTGLEVLAEGLDDIDQLACGADGTLWAVLSRVRSGKLIRIKDGQWLTIARHLRQPQGVALLPDGSLYLAETRANRVLRLSPP